MSLAAGEYVSVSSHTDTERAEQLMAHDALSGQLTRTASIPTVTSTSFPINPMPATFSFQLMP